ncbi:MAG: flagellar hook-length control protein FliK [Pseudomonadota bacterium]
MTVASDTSVASIFRPTSGPRTEANTDKKEGTGSFGMMLDQTNQPQTRADAPAPRDDHAPARTGRRDDSRPVADRRADAPKTKDSKDPKTADRTQNSQTSDAKPSSDVKNAADGKDAQAAQQGSDTQTAQDANAAANTQTEPALPATATADLTALTDAAAQAGAGATEATGKTAATNDAPAEDTASTTDTTKDSEKTADTTAVAVMVVADATQIPAAPVAVSADPTAPVAPAGTTEGNADAIAALKAANTQGAAPATEAPKEAGAPVVTQPEAKSGAKPEIKADTKPEAKIDGAEPKLATTEAKPASDVKPEPAIKFGNDDSAPKPEVKDTQHAKHPSEVNREIAADATVKAADTALAAAKAGIDSVQNLNAPAQPTAAPALQLNVAATAAAAGAATANNVTSNTVPIDGVAVEIATQSQNGKHSFEIRLDPKELGRIDVRLEVDKDGHVTTKLMVDRAETLDMLKRDSANIERTLQQAGLKTSDNTLQFSLRDQSFNNNNTGNRDSGANANTTQLVLPDDDGVPLEAVRSNYGRLLGFGRGLDIRI